jgi:hypothetical protein
MSSMKWFENANCLLRALRASVVNRFSFSACSPLIDRADAELEVANVRVGTLFAQVCQDLFFLERQLLNDDGVRDGDFQDAAFEAAGKRVGCEGFAGGFSPGGREIGGGLDAAIAAGRDQLGEDVFDGFGPAGIVAALFAVPAKGKVGGGLGVVVDGCWRNRNVCSSVFLKFSLQLKSTIRCSSIWKLSAGSNSKVLTCGKHCWASQQWHSLF